MIDGSGVRGFSQLEIMDNIVHRLNWKDSPNDLVKEKRPYEHFDMIGGSGTGGSVCFTTKVF